MPQHLPDATNLAVFLIVAIFWVASLCLHEYAHARVAYAGGDTTVAAKGYLSFNPLRYIHPVYSILMPLAFLALGGLGLPGGAVYIEHWRLRSRQWDMAVSAAGPLANLLLALVVGAVMRLAPVDGSLPWAILAFFGLLQVSSVVLNLLPVPPLDGYGIIAPLLDPETRARTDRAGQFGMWIVFLALWYVPQVGQAFWRLVYRLCDLIGIPADLAIEGYRAFRIF